MSFIDRFKVIEIILFKSSLGPPIGRAGVVNTEEFVPSYHEMIAFQSCSFPNSGKKSGSIS